MKARDTKPPAIVVTGGSAGIGRAICESLLEQGREVVNVDRAAPAWSHPRLASFDADLADEAQTRACAERIARRFEVTGLVNNAGVTRPGSSRTQTAADLAYVNALTLQSAMLLTQAFLPSLRACGCGRVVNMASRAALGKAERLAYAAAKAGLIGMTRTLALELGAEGITVNAIAPGPIATELFVRSNPEHAPGTRRKNSLISNAGMRASAFSFMKKPKPPRLAR